MSKWRNNYVVKSIRITRRHATFHVGQTTWLVILRQIRERQSLYHFYTLFYGRLSKLRGKTMGEHARANRESLNKKELLIKWWCRMLFVGERQFFANKSSWLFILLLNFCSLKNVSLTNCLTSYFPFGSEFFKFIVFIKFHFSMFKVEKTR